MLDFTEERILLHQLNYQQNQYILFSPLCFSLRYKHDTSKVVLFVFQPQENLFVLSCNFSKYCA